MLLEKYDPSLVCPDCEVFRPFKSRHCHYCDRCVRNFDHHCPWINNCVGKRNQTLFVFLLLIIWLNLLCSVLITLQVCLFDQQGHQVLLYCKVLPDSLLKFKREMQIVISAVCVVFLLPVTVLLFVQCRNLLQGTTTSELYSKSKQDKKLYERYDEQGNDLDLQD